SSAVDPVRLRKSAGGGAGSASSDSSGTGASAPDSPVERVPRRMARAWKELEVSQISQTFFEDRLLGFIKPFGIGAHKFPKHELQERLQAPETGAKLLFRGRAEYLRQAELSSCGHCERDVVLPIVPRTRLRIAATIILSSLSNPASSTNPQ